MFKTSVTEERKQTPNAKPWKQQTTTKDTVHTVFIRHSERYSLRRLRYSSHFSQGIVFTSYQSFGWGPSHRFVGGPPECIACLHLPPMSASSTGFLRHKRRRAGFTCRPHDWRQQAHEYDTNCSYRILSRCLAASSDLSCTSALSTHLLKNIFSTRRAVFKDYCFKGGGDYITRHELTVRRKLTMTEGRGVAIRGRS